jgi:hypothetical protein
MRAKEKAVIPTTAQTQNPQPHGGTQQWYMTDAHRAPYGLSTT